VFRWNRCGVYQDCFFPVTCQHYFGGEQILGRSISEVLPKEASRMLAKAVSRTFDTQRPQEAQLIFSVTAQTVVAVVRLIPYGSETLGFVTDHYLDGRPVIFPSLQDPSLQFLNHSEGM
jgi:hypothetical protein